MQVVTIVPGHGGQFQSVVPLTLVPMPCLLPSHIDYGFGHVTSLAGRQQT